MLNKAKPLQQFLEKGLGGKTKVEIYVPTSYAAVVESLRFGHAHVAFMSAWPAQLAVRLGGAEVALAEVREVLHGKEKVEAPHYYSYWVVAPDSPYKDLPSLKGKSACFPSPISTSGFVAPIGRMVEMNLLQPGEGKEADPKAYFKEVLFGGGYGQCWQALKQGQVDTTVIAGDVPEKLYNEVLAATRTIEHQGPIPSHAVVLSKELKDPLRRAGDSNHRSNSARRSTRPHATFISSIFVGFKPTNGNEHLGSLQKYLKARQSKVHGAPVTHNGSAPRSSSAERVWFAYRTTRGATKCVAVDSVGKTHRHHGAFRHRQNDLAAGAGGNSESQTRAGRGIRQPTDGSASAAQSLIGYIPQQLGLVHNLSALDNVLMGALGRIGDGQALLGLFPRAEIDPPSGARYDGHRPQELRAGLSFKRRRAPAGRHRAHLSATSPHRDRRRIRLGPRSGAGI